MERSRKQRSCNRVLGIYKGPWFNRTALHNTIRRIDRIQLDGLPRCLLPFPKTGRSWQQQNVKSIIERDIHDIVDVKDGQDVAHLLEFLCNQTASLLNIAATANALRHIRPTIERHLGILKICLARITYQDRTT